MKEHIVRILDVNLNRLNEGLRVIEEAVRFTLQNKDLSVRLKGLRSQCACWIRDHSLYQDLLSARDSAEDPGKDPDFDENNLSRTGPADVITASFHRAQEASRVLEEYGKITGLDPAPFKRIRFELYILEKEVLPEIIRQEQ